MAAGVSGLAHKYQPSGSFCTVMTTQGIRVILSQRVVGEWIGMCSLAVIFFLW